MKRINSYLTFNGNCREAMSFYRDCLGGDLVLQSIGESPLATDLPDELKSFIVHSKLTNESLVLIGSDMVPTTGLVKGNSVSLSLECTSEDEIRTSYKRLADSGSADYPLAETFWGALFGGLTDRFGHHWVLNYEPQPTD